METPRTFRASLPSRGLQRLFGRIRSEKRAIQPAPKRRTATSFSVTTRVKMAVIFGLTTIIPLLVMVYIIQTHLVLRKSMGLSWISSLGLIALGIALLGGKLMKQAWERVGEALEVIDRFRRETDSQRKDAPARSADDIDRIPTIVNQLVEVARNQRDKLKAHDRQVQVLDNKVKALIQRLREISREDSLTGLYKQRYLGERAREEVARANRYGRNLALAIIEVDSFEDYSHNVGRAAANNALAAIARIIRDSVRQVDIAFRCGRDQFAIVFPETTAERATVALDRIRTAVENQRFKAESSQPNGALTLSIGASMLRKGCGSVEEFVFTAEEALHKAKSVGPGQMVAFSEDQTALQACSVS